MRKRSIKIWIIIVMLWMLGLTACTTPKLTLQSDLTLKVGESQKLQMTISDSSLEIEWLSDKPEIAEVDNQGNVTGKSAGTAVITAKIKTTDISKSCTVTVNADSESALQAAKIAAKAVLDEYVAGKEALYDSDEWTQVQTAVTAGKSAIDGATSVALITAAKNDAITAINAINTKIDTAINQALQDLAAYMDAYKDYYKDEDLAAIDAIVDAAAQTLRANAVIADDVAAEYNAILDSIKAFEPKAPQLDDIVEAYEFLVDISQSPALYDEIKSQNPKKLASVLAYVDIYIEAVAEYRTVSLLDSVLRGRLNSISGTYTQARDIVKVLYNANALIEFDALMQEILDEIKTFNPAIDYIGFMQQLENKFKIWEFDLWDIDWKDDIKLNVEIYNDKDSMDTELAKEEQGAPITTFIIRARKEQGSASSYRYNAAKDRGYTALLEYTPPAEEGYTFRKWQEYQEYYNFVIYDDMTIVSEEWLRYDDDRWGNDVNPIPANVIRDINLSSMTPMYINGYPAPIRLFAEWRIALIESHFYGTWQDSNGNKYIINDDGTASYVNPYVNQSYDYTFNEATGLLQLVQNGQPTNLRFMEIVDGKLGVSFSADMMSPFVFEKVETD